MQPRIRLWLLMMIGIFIISFLVGFQPIRRPPGDVVTQAAFRYQLPTSLTDNEAEYTAKAQEVRTALVEGGFSEEFIEDVALLSGDMVEIKTYAMDESEAAAHEKELLGSLQKTYEGVRLSGRTDQEQQEQPLYKLGNVLAVYKPSPKIKLGLDLQGGLHVVLRCLPYASMAFLTSEEQDVNEPLYATKPVDEKPKDEEKPADEDQDAKTEEETDTDDEKSDEAAEKPEEPEKPTTPTISKAGLEKKVVAELVRAGLAQPGTVEAKAVSAERLLVRTQAGDERTAKQQRSTVLRMLQGMYPDYKTLSAPEDDFEVVLIETDTADKVKNVIDRRLFALGDIREPVIQKQGRDQIIVELPGVKDPERVAGILKSTALLEFRLIPERYENMAPGADIYDEWKDKRTGEVVSWDRVLAESDAEFRGADLIPNSRVIAGDSPSEWKVTFDLKANKKRDFHEFTRRNVGRLMAIVLDNQCQMAPVINSPIPGQGVIEGNFSPEEAGDLRLLLNAGALPVPLEIAENRTVSATLGQDSVARSLRAGLVGLLVVLIFMVAYYRLPGVLADIALFMYVLIVIGVMAASQLIKGVGGVTLTLPGVAGIILSIGMAVDANVIIFERLKEELWSGKSMRAAVVAGFDRAWSAILDSNLTTLIITAVLYFLGTSLIKSFAATLFIGVLCSLFTAVTVTRWLITMVAETKLAQNLALFGVAQSDREG